MSKSMTGFARISLILVVLGGTIATAWAESSGELEKRLKYHHLAAFHAPVVFQETGGSPKADAITRVDYDGDWVSNNNWNNLDHYGTPASVYYAVVESETHWFITYAFFHPRDYSWVCIPFVCHENDMEGASVTVEKSARNGGLGHVLYLETKAHLSMDATTTPLFVLAPGEDPASRDQGRVALFVQKQGHGVYPMKPSELARRASDGRHLHYYFGNRADDPRSARSGKFSFDLIPLELTVWAMRNNQGTGKTFRGEFNHDGARYSVGRVPTKFAGDKYARGMVSPPWAWADGGGGNLKKGDWFFDPAFAVARRFPVSADFSLTYLYNPFVGIH